MVDIGREMALPMEQIIGGPLQAVIKAQSLAASETSDFIHSIGLAEGEGADNGKLVARTIDFSFTRKRPKAQKDGSTKVDPEKVTLNVPLLTMVPVPYIRIEEATIDFECKVSSSTLDSTTHDAGVKASASGGFWGVKVSVQASYSFQKVHKDQVDKSATLRVHVKAVQDEMPAGLRTVLDILETAVTDAGAEAVVENASGSS